MPAFQGLDRAAAPSAATARQMLDRIGGRWWNVYIGGPESAGSGWSPELIRDYVRHGIDRFMLTYVGQQTGGSLTRAQGQRDARDALQLAAHYGYGGSFPLCLDVEMGTFTGAPATTVEYVRAWCDTVRRAGARPGIYANPGPLKAMASGGVHADFVWVASWVSRHVADRHPHAITGLPANLWSKPGQRAWQYAGALQGVPCEVLGLSVDISVADLGCLAPPPGVIAGAAHARARAPRSARQPARRSAATGRDASKPARAATRLPELVKQFERLDAEANRAWQRIEAYGQTRRRLLARADAGRNADLADITGSLKRIEHQLELLVDLEQREVAIADAAPVAPEPIAAYAGEIDAAAVQSHSPAQRRLADLADAELDERIDRLDHRLDRSRRERIARWARVEKRLVHDADGRIAAPVRRPQPRTTPREPAAEPLHPARRPQRSTAATAEVRSLQRSLNRFTKRSLKGIPPLEVDGRKGTETDKRIQTVKHYLGYEAAERTATVTSGFVRRLRHPGSPRYSDPRALARAASRRRRQRKAALRLGSAPIEGTPKHIVDTIVLPIAAACGIHVTPATIVARNATHGPTKTGTRSDHQGPPELAWAADLSNGGSPTPEMDELARRLAQRFDIDWHGSGLVNAHNHGYRFQMLYRTEDHFDHVHFGIKVE